MYCAIDLLFDRVRGRGSTVAAGPISDTPAGANRWDGGERETGRTVRQRVLVPVDTPALRAALKAPAEEVSKRCRSMLKQLKTQSGPRPADIVALEAATWPENMAVLMEMMSTIAAVRHGRRVHPPNRQRWAMQLLLEMTHVVGQAMTTTTRWPRTWTHAEALGPGKQVSRPTLKNQQLVFEWRVINGFWPRADDDVARWYHAY